MKRIFLTLVILSSLLLAATFALGLVIDDPSVATTAVQAGVQYHFLTAAASLFFAALVHAIVLTYFMGTGRWLEETGNAYGLESRFRAENVSLKSRVIPGMCGCLVLLVISGATGAAVDPASSVSFQGWAGIPGATIHFLIVSLSVGVNLIVNLIEYQYIDRNNRLVDEVLAQVRVIREERGLPV